MDHIQTAALDKYRDINVDSIDWWFGVLESERERMRERGISVDHIHFSGFGSQGDGACVVGSIFDAQAFFRYHKLADTFPMMSELAPKATFCLASWEHDRHARYYHENTVRVLHTDAYDTDFLELGYDVDLLQDMGQPILDKFSAERKDFESFVETLVHDMCVEAYKALEEEYDYLTSDDAIMETLVANDLLED